MYVRHPSRYLIQHSGSRHHHDKQFGTKGGNYSGRKYERTSDRRCFNCGKPKRQLCTYPEEKYQERIGSNLSEWRKMMKLKKLLRHINLVELDTLAFTVHEAWSAKIYLEQVNDTPESEKGHAAHFF